MLDERQHKSTADSDTASVAVLPDSLAEERADIEVIRRITSFHCAPLPDPETLIAYSKLIPDGPHRIMCLVEREAAHRHERGSADIAQAVRGHWMAFILTLVLGGGGVWLGLQNHDWLAAALFTTTIGAVMATLVADGRTRHKRNADHPDE